MKRNCISLILIAFLLAIGLSTHCLAEEAAPAPEKFGLIKSIGEQLSQIGEEAAKKEVPVIEVQPAAGEEKTETAIPDVVVVTEPAVAEQKQTSDTAPAISNEKQTVIVVFGDSLVSGYSLPAEQALPAKLEAKLKSYGKNVKVINEGKNSENTEQALVRINMALAHQPDMVILVTGTNDMLADVDTGAISRNLDVMIKYLQTAGKKVLLCGVKATPGKDENYSYQFGKIYYDLAEKHKVDFFPFFLAGVAGEKDLNMVDGVHPNEKGVDVIVNNITPYIFKSFGWYNR